MKIYQIVVFMLVFQVSIGLINASGAFNDIYERAYDAGLISEGEVSTKSGSLDQTQFSQGNDFMNAVGNFMLGANIFFSSVASSVVSVKPTILFLFGPAAEHPTVDTIANLISAIVYFIYAVGIFQFVSNRSLKSME